MKVIGYIRRSTNKQENSIEVQVQRLRDVQAIIGGWDELDLRVEDATSGTSMENRPVLGQALADLKAGRADAVAVTKLDRLARSSVDAAQLIRTARTEGWHIIAMDLGVDTRTPTGRMVAHILAAVGEWEAERISERTRETLAYKRDRGTVLGRPSPIPVETVERIAGLHGDGMSASAIARLFNAEGVSKGVGARSQQWNHSHVVAAVRRAEVRSRADVPQG